MPDFSIEQEQYSKGFKAVAGIDEAGRGPLAGPVCAAAVLLPGDIVIDGLDDSKKLTEKKREKLYDVIIEKALAYGIAFASPAEIDEVNILNATFLAMNRAVDAMSIAPDLCIIDGNNGRGVTCPHICVVKGDSISVSVAAASVLAKVTRDRYMRDMDAAYPGYGFAKYKGYPTKAHYEAIRALGPSEIHRTTFLRKMH
ncbi:MAG: ribonuclease HII [Oscillospiraceae bacterium]|nr:ribonuclease HII [Oscillospiraceae bacterium]